MSGREAVGSAAGVEVDVRVQELDGRSLVEAARKVDRSWLEEGTIQSLQRERFRAHLMVDLVILGLRYHLVVLWAESNLWLQM